VGRWRICLLLSCNLSASPAAAQKAHLTSEEIAQAILQGQKNPNAEQGLLLVDKGQAWAKAMLSPHRAGSGSGFSIVLYTPTTWIRRIAAEATKEGRPFTAQQVTEEMLEPLLYVVVNPDVPSRVDASGMVGTSSVQGVVLRDEQRREDIEPVDVETFERGDPDKFASEFGFQGVAASFVLEDLTRIRSAGRDGEFLVTVIGSTGEEKNFKIKKKFFAFLP